MISVMNMWPGAWVIAMGGFAFSTAACGVTPQLAILSAKPPIAITHAAGHMFVSDLKNSELEQTLFA